MPKKPPDYEQRCRITSELRKNLLVEAAAGTGKTTSMIDRMVRLLAEGECRVETLAAVTFTRKAAAEIRSRFQRELERAATAAAGDERTRLMQALENLERCFIGTIHSFCARLLRERPVEAGVDLNFQELDEVEDGRLLKQAWQDHVAELVAMDADIVEEMEESHIRVTARTGRRKLVSELEELGLQVADLQRAFQTIAGFADVSDWPAPVVPAPPLEPVRARLEEYREHLRELVPTLNLQDKTLQPKLRDVHQAFVHARLEDPVQCSQILERFSPVNRQPTLKHYPGGKPQALAEWNRWNEMREQVALPWLNQWREHRYEPVMRAIQPACERYEQLRSATNALNFQDLMLKCVALLRDYPQVRRYFADRITHLLVDEFQDTDPLQAEILFLLTADDPEERSWLRCRPRPGSLFIVGDPKQSIYRFRRADVAIYRQTKQLIQTHGGEVVSLTANFRSGTEILDFVNDHFDHCFPSEEDDYRPANHRLQKGSPVDAAQGDLRGIFRINVPSDATTHDAVCDAEATQIARFIRNAIDQERTIAELGPDDTTTPRPVRPSDFLLLTWGKARIDVFTNRLHELALPYEVTNGQALNTSAEVQLLNLCVQSITRPDDSLALLAVVRSPLFGISDPTLFRLRDELGTLRWTRQIPDVESAPADWRVAQRAFEQLRQYAGWMERRPAVTAIEAMAEDLGLVARACRTPFRPLATGALVKTFELLRQVQWQALTPSDLADYLQQLVLCEEKHDAVSLAHAPSAVRVMNLHQAKGLEAPVVFLCGAIPPGGDNYPTDLHIRRGESTEGYLAVYEDAPGYGAPPCLAHPRDWEQWRKEEDEYLAAERERLHYVAATRAARMLVISYRESKKWPSIWEFFHPSLADVPELEIPPAKTDDSSPSDTLSSTPTLADCLDARRHVAERVAAAAVPSYRVESAKKRALAEQTKTVFGSGEHGTEWGTVIHLLLEAAMSGRRMKLDELAVSILEDQGLDPALAPQAVAVIHAVQKSDLWQRAQASRQRMIEVPFQYLVEPDDGSPPTILRGVVDLAFRDSDGWVLADYKTDSIQADQVSELVDYYRPQLDQYAQAWLHATGEPVSEAGFYFTHLKQYVPVPLS